MTISPESTVQQSDRIPVSVYRLKKRGFLVTSMVPGLYLLTYSGILALA
jgi:hypothetical protein